MNQNYADGHSGSNIRTQKDGILLDSKSHPRGVRWGPLDPKNTQMDDIEAEY